jgi:transposase-like protein
MKRRKNIRPAKRRTARQSHEQTNLFSSADESKTNADPSPRGCHITAVGKRRDGGTRYWCLSHKADATAKYGKPADTCRAAHIPPISSEDMLELNIDKYKGGIALWGAVPAVYDTTRLPMDRGIHVHARVAVDSEKETDRTFRAVRLTGGRVPRDGILVSEIDAIYYMATSVFGYPMKHIVCPRCGYSHLDRDWFSVHPHRRHLCAGCGKHFSDTETAVGNPICGIREPCDAKVQKTIVSKRKLHIKQGDYPGGIQIWGSNPALLWTSDRAEEEGIHVHAFLKNPSESDDEPDSDETYGEVIIDGVSLDSSMVRVLMAQNALPSLKNRVIPTECPACHNSLFEVGELAFTPTVKHTCRDCGHGFTTSGRFRRTIANPLPGVLAQLAKKAPRPPQHHDLGLMPETL